MTKTLSQRNTDQNERRHQVDVRKQIDAENNFVGEIGAGEGQDDAQVRHQRDGDRAKVNDRHLGPKERCERAEERRRVTYGDDQRDGENDEEHVHADLFHRRRNSNVQKIQCGDFRHAVVELRILVEMLDEQVVGGVGVVCQALRPAALRRRWPQKPHARVFRLVRFEKRFV